MKDLVKILIFLAIVTVIFLFLASTLGSKIFLVLSRITLVIDAFVLIGIFYKKFFT